MWFYARAKFKKLFPSFFFSPNFYSCFLFVSRFLFVCFFFVFYVLSLCFVACTVCLSNVSTPNNHLKGGGGGYTHERYKKRISMLHPSLLSVVLFAFYRFWALPRASPATASRRATGSTGPSSLRKCLIVIYLVSYFRYHHYYCQFYYLFLRWVLVCMINAANALSHTHASTQLDTQDTTARTKATLVFLFCCLFFFSFSTQPARCHHIPERASHLARCKEQQGRARASIPSR